MKTCLGLATALALTVTLAYTPPALACCAPCDNLCAQPGVSPDTVCCTGVPTPCDGCGSTACGACAWESTLDASCATGCAADYLACVADPTTAGCHAAWGLCMDSCWDETFTCGQPPCPIDCDDDEHEEDDTFEHAAKEPPLMNPAGGKPVLLDGLVSQAFDPDWFHAYGDCCNTIWAIVTWDASLGDLDLSLHDEKGEAYQVGDPGFVHKDKPGFAAVRLSGHGGHFYLQVTNADGDCVPYELKVYAPVYL